MEPRAKPVPVEQARGADPRDLAFQKELAEHNRMGDIASQLGLGVQGGESFNHGADDAVAHLQQMPEDRAVEVAKQWTGDQSISSLDEAIAAVQQALGG